ncbi:hypothetical protein [Streptomyces sp. V3I7]|uniref:hypothetical protein n=1 Tax=Streptomyces sp. V3I7 TaxID=3042278 RepID=UPI0027872F36|nr:hypothetical protein [Streptomyces sp. V3I7]MDQ0990936.1 hypothetical protein [Streptomyces sp. V3I7]
MGFKVVPDDLEAYGKMIDRAGQDALQGKAYLNRHSEISTQDQGLFTRPFDFHDSLRADVADVFDRLHSLLDASSRELVRSAGYYRDTDQAEAAKVDAVQPPSKR